MMIARSPSNRRLVCCLAWSVAVAAAQAAIPLVALADESSDRAPTYGPVQCEGSYPGHLQGLAVDGQGAIFWSFTTELVKTDAGGKILHKVDVPSHHGDLTFVDGMLYVAVNLGPFNDPQGKADSWVSIYRADDLSLVAKHKLEEVIYGAGGMAARDGHFFVIGGLPPGIEENYVYEYDDDFQLVKKHAIASRYTLLGIQTAEYADGHWWFGCYGQPEQLLVTDEDFALEGRHDFGCSLGIAAVGEGRFLVAERAPKESKGHIGRLQIARPDQQNGLRRETSSQ